MEEIWNHPASISVCSWLICKVTSTDLCNVLYSFLSLNVLNKYFTNKERVMLRVYELCHSRSVLVLAHYFKNELCFLCSVLVLTHRFKNDLCVPCLFRLTALRTSSVAC